MAAAWTLAPCPAHADEAGGKPTAAPAAVPPALSVNYLQYGVGFTGEFVTTAGAMCRDAGQAGAPPCIFGSGGGVAIRVGWRAAGPWYFGGAYEVTKHDPSNLYRLATLQQVRGEARYYIPTGWETTPYASAGAGLAGYGNEMGIDTWGPTAYLSAGAEVQISRVMVAGAALGYRLLYFTSFTDSSGATRDAGIAQVVGLDLTLEARDPL